MFFGFFLNFRGFHCAEYVVNYYYKRSNRHLLTGLSRISTSNWKFPQNHLEPALTGPIPAFSSVALGPGCRGVCSEQLHRWAGCVYLDGDGYVSSASITIKVPPSHLFFMSLLGQGQRKHTVLPSGTFPVYSSTWCNEEQAHSWLSHLHCRTDLVIQFLRIFQKWHHKWKSLDNIKTKPVNHQHKWKKPPSLTNNSWRVRRKAANRDHTRRAFFLHKELLQINEHNMGHRYGTLQGSSIGELAGWLLNSLEFQLLHK